MGDIASDSSTLLCAPSIEAPSEEPPLLRGFTRRLRSAPFSPGVVACEGSSRWRRMEAMDELYQRSCLPETVR